MIQTKKLKGIPEWLLKNDAYTPPSGSVNFLQKNLLTVLAKLTALREEKNTGKHGYSTSFRLIFLFTLLLCICLSQATIFLLLISAALLAYISTLTSRHILMIIKPALAAAIFSLLLLLPAVLSHLTVFWFLPLKIFLSTAAIMLFTVSTPFYLLTRAFKTLQVPSFLILLLDITLRYITLLGSTAESLLVALKLRCVGKNTTKYQSLGSVTGTIFLKAQENASETYSAMLCRCFTGEYTASGKYRFQFKQIFYAAILFFFLLTFICLEGYWSL